MLGDGHEIQASRGASEVASGGPTSQVVLEAVMPGAKGSTDFDHQKSKATVGLDEAGWKQRSSNSVDVAVRNKTDADHMMVYQRIGISPNLIRIQVSERKANGNVGKCRAQVYFLAFLVVNFLDAVPTAAT